MSEWTDGMDEHDQLRALVVENQRLQAQVEHLTAEAGMSGLHSTTYCDICNPGRRQA